jgi:TrmH family RNA methyltransferase
MLSKSKIKYIQTLGQKKFREEEGFFIAEGPKLVKELLDFPGVNIEGIYALKEWISNNEKAGDTAPVTEITGQELGRISQLSTPNSVLAVVQQFEPNPDINTKGQIILALDGIQDPGNLGTIIRTADWFDIRNIVCSPDCADLYNPKVVQSTMGSIARVNLIYTDLWEWLSGQENIPIYATALEGEDITGMKGIEEGVIITGNESKGISSEILNLANTKITIPRKGNAESLNAAVATGIVLSYLVAGS